MESYLKRRFILSVVALLGLVVIISGCTPAESENPEAAVDTAAEVAAALPTEAPAAPTSPPPTSPPPASPTPLVVEADESSAETMDDVVEEEPAEAAEIAEEAVEPPPAEVEVVEVETATFGRTADGAFFRGREDAPVTIIDYSDFL